MLIPFLNSSDSTRTAPTRSFGSRRREFQIFEDFFVPIATPGLQRRNDPGKLGIAFETGKPGSISIDLKSIQPFTIALSSDLYAASLLPRIASMPRASYRDTNCPCPIADLRLTHPWNGKLDDSCGERAGFRTATQTARERNSGVPPPRRVSPPTVRKTSSRTICGTSRITEKCAS